MYLLHERMVFTIAGPALPTSRYDNIKIRRVAVHTSTVANQEPEAG